MKNVYLMSLLMMTSLTLKAQTISISGTLQYQKDDMIEYAKSPGIFVSQPEVKIDKMSKKSTAVWHKTNMDWIKDYCEAKNVAVESDYLKLFPEIADIPQDDNPYELATDRGRQ